MYFRTLQVLRGLAALMVVLYHLQHYAGAIGENPQTWCRFFDVHFSYGAWFFFVLSGFLMAYLIDTGYEWFLPRRLLRIYPTYLLAVMLVVFAKAVVFDSVTSPYLARAVSLLPFGARAGGKAIAYPLGVEWTLIFEVFFYLVCSCFAVGWLRRLFLPFLLAWGVSIVAAEWLFRGSAWYVLSAHESALLPSIQHIGLSAFNQLFIAGGISYYVYKRIGRISLGGAVGLGVVAAAAFYGFDRWPAMPAALRLSLMGLSFGLVIFLVCVWERSRPGRTQPSWLERFGDCSYALYLLHVPVITVLFYVVRYALHYPINNAICLLALVASLVVGWYYGKVDLFLHHSLKNRFGRRAKRPSPREPDPAPAMAGGN